MSIPAALQTRPLPSVDTMNIDTTILEPLVITKNFCRFVLERKGILDSGSTIQLAVKVPGSAATPNVACLPLHTGIHAAINRAVLRIGTKVVAITDSYGTYATVHRSCKTAEEKSQKDFVTKGTIDAVCPSLGQDGMYDLRDVDLVAAAIPPAVSNFQPLAQQFLKSADGESPLYTIKISDLFPMMRSVQLPLYIITEPCSIELHFNVQNGVAADQGKLAVFMDTTVPLNTRTAEVDTTSVRFLCDYLTYSDDSMNEASSLAASEQGMVIPYEDVVTTNTNFPAVAAPVNPTPATYIRDIGISGMKVRTILGHYRENTADFSPQVLGQYKSAASAFPLSYNLRVNDKEVYQRPQDNEAKKSTEFAQCMNAPISVGNGEYSFDSLTDKESALRPTNNDYISASHLGPVGTSIPLRTLQGGSHFTGTDFSSPGNYGVSCGQKPVRVTSTLTSTATDYGGRTVSYFSMVERSMAIRGGVVTVSA
tara:strand:+ start:942 stop:2384 length:1443 start_codon:yes stop_codon:yes gene_type:complete